ncbi:hypothetical protein [Legionella genomosp. 1]|uniref:hypothetical protein n=1 Tax=Legionella genomosp. 1 TaxID=1093625 RepID=UPI001054EDB0|nr:hypothetical protein [Legionella genomosp. 1]
MAASEDKVFDDLFVQISKNYRNLLKTNLAVYLNEFPDFPELLELLKKKGFFKGKEAIPYTAADFIKSLNLSEQQLQATPVELLASSSPILDEAKEYTFPAELSDLHQALNCYVELITDVLQNKLAQKPYENPGAQENVTEQEHALEAGKLSLILLNRLEYVLALLCHDIARPSINDPVYGHSRHCQEGSDILAPLGLSLDYAGHHAFAKYLLYLCCPSYKQLISNTSKSTLKIQEQGLSAEIEDLNSMDVQSLAKTFYMLMFMRLIDDESKVSIIDVKRQLRGRPLDFFDAETIQTLVCRQLGRHLQERLAKGEAIQEVRDAIELKLNKAFTLLLRARDASNAPQLYEKYKSVLDEIKLSSLSAQEQITI